MPANMGFPRPARGGAQQRVLGAAPVQTLQPVTPEEAAMLAAFSGEDDFGTGFEAPQVAMWPVSAPTADPDIIYRGVSGEPVNTVPPVEVVQPGVEPLPSATPVSTPQQTLEPVTPEEAAAVAPFADVDEGGFDVPEPAPDEAPGVNPPTYRGDVLPFEENLETGELSWAWPRFLDQQSEDGRRARRGRSIGETLGVMGTLLSPYNLAYILGKSMVVDPLVNGGRVFKRAFEGEMIPPEEAFMLTLDFTPFGKANAVGRSGTSLGTFGGRLAKTADHDALAKAKAMQKSGTARDDIWRDTGWFQGKDGKWRFEIDDRGAKFRDFPSLKDNPTKAGRAFDHKELYAAYPKLKDEVTFSAQEMEGSVKGTHDPVTRNIAVTRGKSDPRATALHELQHEVQDIEGFKPGGSEQHARHAKQGARQKLPGIDRRLAEISDEIALKQRQGDREGMAELRQAQDELRQFKERLEHEALATPLQIYEHFPGEVEARRVEARRNYTPEQRSRELPWTAKRQVMEQLNSIESSADYNEAVRRIDNLRKLDNDEAREEVKRLTGLIEEYDARLLAERDELIELKQRLERIVRIDPEELAQYLPGEIEARNVETRKDFTPEQRRSIPPWETED